MLLAAGRSNAAIPEAQIQAQGLVANDFFGRTLAVFDEQVIVGSNNLTTARNGGIVYAFSNDGEAWKERYSLRGSQSGRSSSYGSSELDLYRDTLIVGARGSNRNGKGAAYIYHRNAGGIDQWGERAFLQDSREAVHDNDGFGSAVALGNHFAIVGSPLNDDLGRNVGKVFVYEKQGEGPATTWDEFTKLTPSNANPFTAFGNSVAISGSHVLVGTAQYIANEAGVAAYLYRLGESGRTTTEIARLEIDHLDYAINGRHVALSDTTAVVTGYNGVDNAYFISVFQQEDVDNWELFETLEFPSDYRQISISLHQDRLAVGVPDYQEPDRRPGAVFLYDLANFQGVDSPLHVLTADCPVTRDCRADDAIGGQVDLHGNTIVTSAENARVRRGEAFVFSVPEPTTGVQLSLPFFCFCFAVRRKLAALDEAARLLRKQTLPQQ